MYLLTEYLINLSIDMHTFAALEYIIMHFVKIWKLTSDFQQVEYLTFTVQWFTLICVGRSILSLQFDLL